MDCIKYAHLIYKIPWTKYRIKTTRPLLTKPAWFKFHVLQRAQRTRCPKHAPVVRCACNGHVQPVGVDQQTCSTSDPCTTGRCLPPGMAKQTQGEFSNRDRRPLYVVTSTTLPTREMPFMAGDAWLCSPPAAISLETADTALALAIGAPGATIRYVVWDRLPDSDMSDRCSALFEISKAALGNVYLPAMYATMHNCYTALTRNTDVPSLLSRAPAAWDVYTLQHAGRVQQRKFIAL